MQPFPGSWFPVGLHVVDGVAVTGNVPSEPPGRPACRSQVQHAMNSQLLLDGVVRQQSAAISRRQDQYEESRTGPSRADDPRERDGLSRQRLREGLHAAATCSMRGTVDSFWML